MNKLELKSLVMKYFQLEDKQPETPLSEQTQRFTEGKLQDGTIISNDVDAPFEVGQTLYVITEDGQKVTAPTGEHVLEDGSVVVINEEGHITGIKEPDATGEGSLEASEVEMSSNDEVTAEEAAGETEAVAEVKTEMEEHDETEIVEMDIREEIVSAIADVVQPEIEAMKEKMAEIEEVMKEHYSSTPASEPTVESRFSKIQKIKTGENKGLNIFDAKKAQMEMILKQRKSRINN